MTNVVIEQLKKIVAAADNTHIAHGRRTYAIGDPECPQAKVVAFVKTQLEKLLVTSEKESGA